METRQGAGGVEKRSLEGTVPMQTSPGQPSAPFDPYAPPRALSPTAAHAVPTQGTLPGANVALYTAGHVALASFFGTVLGGALVLSINEGRMGRKAAAWKTLVLGVLGSGLLISLAFVLPSGVGGAPLGILPVVAMHRIARQRQKAIVEAHLAAGGKRGSGWAAFGLGSASLVAVFVVAMIVAVVTNA